MGRMCGVAEEPWRLDPSVRVSGAARVMADWLAPDGGPHSPNAPRRLPLFGLQRAATGPSDAAALTANKIKNAHAIAVARGFVNSSDPDVTPILPILPS